MDRGLSGRLLSLDADSEIQVNVIVANKTALEVAGQARVSGGVNAMSDRSAQQSLRVGRLDHVQRSPGPMAGGEAFYVHAKGALVVFADSGAYGERDKSSRQGVLSRQPVVDAHLEQGCWCRGYSA